MADSKESDSGRQNELRRYLSKNMYLYDFYKMYSPVEKFTFPEKFRDLQQKIRDMEVYEDDTWLLTYPRSGASWARPLLWLIANDLDYSNETNMLIRFPTLDLSVFEQHNAVLQETKNCEVGDSVEYAKNLKRPRFLWTHLPLSLLPTQLLEKKPKIVLLIRNPKDAAVSYYHVSCDIEGYTGTPEMYFEAFREGLVSGGCYWHHLASFRKLWGKPNVLNLTFEDMKKDYTLIVRKVADFYGKNYSDDELKNLESYLTFSNMKNVKSLNLEEYYQKMQEVQKRSVSKNEFLRKGETGGYRSEMSEETIKKFDDWSREMKKKLNLTDDERIPY